MEKFKTKCIYSILSEAIIAYCMLRLCGRLIENKKRDNFEA